MSVNRTKHTKRTHTHTDNIADKSNNETYVCPIGSKLATLYCEPGMDLRLPRGLALPTNAVEEVAPHVGLSVLEDGRPEPLHWRNLLEEARCKGTLLDMHSSLVAGLTCNLCSEIVHEPVLLECGCSMLICMKHAPMLDRCPHCRGSQQFQGRRATKPNRQLQAVLDSITFMCPRCGRTGIHWMNSLD